MDVKALQDERVRSYSAYLRSQRPTVQTYSSGATLFLVIAGFFTFGVTWLILIAQGLSKRRQYNIVYEYDAFAQQQMNDYLRNIGHEEWI